MSESLQEGREAKSTGVEPRRVLRYAEMTRARAYERPNCS